MIHEKFPEYEDRIAIGMVGEGSDCFEFDDDISKDHDYGIGFCMWLTDSDYEKIGESLQKEYNKLYIDLAEAYPTQTNYLDKRRGVFRIDQFYESLLQMKPQKEHQFLTTTGEWLSVEEERLALCVNGEVFRDDAKIFSSIRNHINAYYPETIWRALLAQQIHIFSQNAQYNYARMMARQDMISAQICVMQAVKAAMSIVYLLNKTYAPYYKWMRKGMENLEILSDIMPLLEKISVLANQKDAWTNVEYRNDFINKKDKKVSLFEDIAEKIVEELNRQKIVSGKNTFLDLYCMQIANGKGGK